jgi:hypothetical protein
MDTDQLLVASILTVAFAWFSKPNALRAVDGAIKPSLLANLFNVIVLAVVFLLSCGAVVLLD